MTEQTTPARMTNEAQTQTDLTPEQVEAAFDREEREAERIAENEAADAECNEPGVGFVGCSSSGRVLRVRVANRNRQRMRVKCPHGCGEHDTPKSMARPLLKGESRPKLSEIPPDELERVTGDKGSGVRKVSDAALLDALPTEDAPATTLGREFGYTGASPGTSLTVRLRRMNERAEKQGVSPPFVFTRVGRSMMIRRASS